MLTSDKSPRRTRKARLNLLLNINGYVFMGSSVAFLLGLLWGMCSWIVCIKGLITSVVVFLMFAFLLHLIIGTDAEHSDNG